MKKTVLIYNVILYSICIVICLIDLFTSSYNFESLFLIIFSLICLLFIYFVFDGRNVKRSLSFLSLINLIQSFSFILKGLSFKILVGTDFSLYLINASDDIVKFSMKIFNIYSYFNYVKNDDNLAIGINFFHLLMFVYFHFEAKK